MLCVEVNWSHSSQNYSWVNGQTHGKALLHGFLASRAWYARGTQEIIRLAIDIDVARPTNDLISLAVSIYLLYTKIIQLTEPVQNFGQSAFRAVPLPWLSHADK